MGGSAEADADDECIATPPAEAKGTGGKPEAEAEPGTA